MHRFADKPGQAQAAQDSAQETEAGHERGTPGSRDEEYLLTEGEALLAATLALMTGFGNGCCTAHKAAMASRVAEQLALLARPAGDADRSPDMRAFLLRLCQRWQQAAQEQAAASRAAAIQALAGTSGPASLPFSVLWHEPLETLQ
ncbi:hypothetical protein V8Z74_17285 [Comamonas sp. w2-DMI]|uniref:hypothetical protein n=1 Tax=Comamonas sp. w2-DMI TaxID=3126391 RepID=UPI0032E3B0C2